VALSARIIDLGKTSTILMLPFKVTLSLSMMYVSIARIGGDVTAVILMVAINSLSGGVDRMRCGLYLLLLRC